VEVPGLRNRQEQVPQELIQKAIADIAADVRDLTRCDRWREEAAPEVLKLK